MGFCRSAPPPGNLSGGKTLLRSPAAVKPLSVGMGRKLYPSKAPRGLGLVSQPHRFSKGWDPEIVPG